MLVDSILQTYQSSIPNIGDNNEDNKLFEDMTLLAKATDIDSSVLENTIRINYANDFIQMAKSLFIFQYTKN